MEHKYAFVADAESFVAEASGGVISAGRVVRQSFAQCVSPHRVSDARWLRLNAGGMEFGETGPVLELATPFLA